MTDKPNDKAEDKRTDKAPEKVDPAKQRADIAAEYETLLTQDQDEPSIIKALCSKYSLDQVALGELMAESRKPSGSLGKGPAASGSANPAHEGQMGTAPPKGTVQSGKEPKTD